MLIDIHCHLDHEYYKDNLNQLLKEFKEENILVITNGVDFNTNLFCLKLAKENKNILAALGFYPEDALDRETYFKDSEIHEKKKLKDSLDLMKKYKKDFIAFGEVGLDLFQGKDIENQKDALNRIIKIAIEQNKPIIIHSRKAEKELINFLEDKKLNPDKIILHCFSGKKSIINQAIEKGFNFSIPANITRNEIFQYIAKSAPLTKIFTETDGPYLSPDKNQDGSFSINHPRNIRGTIKKIAEIKKLPEEQIETQIEENFNRVFKDKI